MCVGKETVKLSGVFGFLIRKSLNGCQTWVLGRGC